MRRIVWVGLVAGLSVLAGVPAGGAVHLYRNLTFDCSPAEGHLGHPLPAAGPSRTVYMLHYTYLDTSTGLPVTVVAPGDTVLWTWNSEHCHSVDIVGGGTTFASGFHYPAPEPTTPALLPGTIHYPVPTLEPTLDFAVTFTAPGLYNYACKHHGVAGMRGVVVVQ